jgi:hypothetical protein
LDHHLLGSLCADPPNGFFGIERLSIADARNLTTVAIDMNFDVRLFSIMFLGGRNQCGLNAFENDLLFDVFIAVNRIHDSQYFTRVHSKSFCDVFRPPLGKPNCSNCSNCKSFSWQPHGLEASLALGVG